MHPKRFLPPTLIALLINLLLFGLIAPQPVHAAVTIVYAKSGGTSTGTCSSWATACNLSRAITYASTISNPFNGSEIWVMQGTYTPGSAESSTFDLTNLINVAMYGGFAGTESSRSERNWSARETILSGEIGSAALKTDNTYHVVFSNTANPAVILDGFTIRDGYADGIGASSVGGGVYLGNSNLRLANLKIIDNYAKTDGGGLYNAGIPILANVTFTNNTAARGGGMFNRSSGTPSLFNVSFSDNDATGTAPGMGGGGLFSDGSGNLELMNVVFANNTAAVSGGAIFNQSTSLRITSSTFSGNAAGTSGGALYIDSSSPDIYNVIFWGNSAPDGAQLKKGSPLLFTLSNVLIQGGCPAFISCINIVTGSPDPLFVNAAAGDVRLKANSPAIDAGDSSRIPPDIADLDNDGTTNEPTPFDRAGTSRRIDHPRTDTGVGMPVIDLGAYETGNTAPTLNNSGTPTLTAINEDLTLASNTGTLVSAILASGASGDPISDPDPGAQDGIAIFAADTASGSWQYTLNGTNWNALGSPIATTARLLASDATTRLRFVPNANFYGTATISFAAWDLSRGNNGGTDTLAFTGGTTPFSSANETASITVHSVNDAPAIGNIPDRTINEDANTGTLPFTISDVETAAASLTLSATSSNTTLVPVSRIVFGGTGVNRNLTVTPAANQYGSATITVTVNDSSGAANATTSDSFVLSVTAVNDAPTISNISNQITNKNTPTGAIAFTIGDVDPGTTFTVTATSSNTTLVPNANIVVGGTGTSRNLTITPTSNQTGLTTIAVTVSDGGLQASDTFVLNVNAPPTISNIADQTINEDTPTGALAFSIGDPDSPSGSLTISGTSSNTTLVPNTNIVFGGTGTNRTVNVTPTANQYGSATITITVRDNNAATASGTFLLTVNSVNDTPTISNISDQTIDEDSATSAAAFTIGDIETAAASLTLSAASSNTTLVPAANIVFGGSGAARTVTVTPAANQNGSAAITVTVTDGGAGTASDSFVLTVTAVNDAPTISNISDQTIDEDGTTGSIAFTIGDADTGNTLTVSAASSDTTLVPDANIVLGGSGTSRTVTVTPDANQNGSATITITVNDGSGPGNATASDSFLLTVNPGSSVRYASPDGLSSGQCTTWATACALRYAISAAESGDEVWAKTGTHNPGGGTYSFELKNGVAIYGGFAGTETERIQRNWGTNVSILSCAFNCYHVLTANGVDSSAVLDGFTVTGGNANGAQYDNWFGSGMYLENSSPTLTHLIFTDNRSKGYAAFYLVNSSPTLTNVVMAKNHGTIYAESGSPILTNVTIVDDTFTAYMGYGSPQIRNSILKGKKSASALYIVEGTPVVSYSMIEGGYAGTGNLDVDPQFVNESTGDVRLKGSSPLIDAGDNSLVQLDTLDLDADGNTSERLPYDLGHNARFVDNPPADTGSGTAPIVDIGAYEVSLNTAPTLNNSGSPTLTATDDNLAANNGTLISTILSSGAGGDPINDTDPGAQDGIAITAADTANGAWQYSLDGGTIWNAIGAVSNTAARLLASNTSTRLRFAANNNYVGSASITFRAWDLTSGSNGGTADTTTNGGSTSFSTATETASITVNAFANPPTITNIANQTINEDSATSDIAFTVGDLDTPVTSLTVTASSSNTTLVPSGNILLYGYGANYTLKVTPAANKNGTATITVRVSDGVRTTSDTFDVIVNAVNDAPTISTIASQAVSAGAATNPINFTIGDVDTSIDTLTVTATSSNTTYVPNANIVLGGTGAGRSITITPATGQTGSTTITINVSDGALTTSTSFTLSTNTPPTISPNPITDQTTTDEVPVIVWFDIDDAETQYNAWLSYTVTSSNTALVSNIGIYDPLRYGHVKLTLTPNLNQFGTTTITISVTDGLATTTTSFLMTVQQVNDPPTLSNFADRTIYANNSVGPINFTYGDNETAIDSLVLTVTSTNDTLTPASSLVVGGTGANRTLTVTPAANQYGTSTITVSVSDGEITTSRSFVLTVKAGTMYVKPGGSTTSMCSSWTDACELTRALALANSGDEIWVAAGTYSPGVNKAATFSLENGVEIYGGFAGSETSREQRNWITNSSILSGNVGSDADKTNNNFHVVSALSVDNTAILDGFTIQDAFAAGGSWDSYGGALYVVGTSASQLSNPSLRNLVLKDNFAGNGGAAMFMRYSTATVTNVLAWNNTTALWGGAISLENSSPNLNNMVIQGSSLYSNGGGMYINNSSPIMTNITIANSTAASGSGGAIYLVSGSPQLRNAIIWGNSATSGNVLGRSGGTLTIAYSLVQDGCPSGATCDNLVVSNPDPLFVDAASGDFRLDNSSPAIDAGNNSYIPNDIYDLDGNGIASEPLPVDLLGNARFFNHTRADTGSGTPPIVDLGAYETPAANTAPVLNDSGSPTLTDINEDDATNTGTRIVDLLATGASGDPITDADAGSAEGIAITAADTSIGQWQYSLDGTNWLDVDTPAPSAARLLPASSTARLRFLPMPDTTGSATITFRAWDQFSGSSGGTADTNSNGGSTAFSAKTETASITVKPVNDPPTISNITDQSTVEDTATSTIAFTVDDLETAAASLTLSATSSNTTLVPNTNIALGESGSSRTIMVTPAANQNGTTTITVTVSDGTLTASDSFVLTVTAVSDPLTISNISDQSTTEDTATSAIAFNIGDPDGTATLAATSSNTTLVPNSSIATGGSGTNRTITITPAANQNGSATITVTLFNGTSAASDTFVLTVSAVNDAPVNTSVPTINQNATRKHQLSMNSNGVWNDTNDGGTTTITFTYQWQRADTSSGPFTNVNSATGSTYNTQTADNNKYLRLTVTATDNGVGTPAAVSSSASSAAILITNIAPLADVDSLTISEDSPATEIAVLANDTDADGDTLSISAVGAPAHGTASISGTNIRYTPALNQNGSDSFTYTLSDGVGGTTSGTVNITINATNDAPVNTSLPTISQNATRKHELSMTSSGVWNDTKDGGATTITFTYQWQRANASAGPFNDIVGATASSYNAQSADVGKYLRLLVTATDNGVGTPAAASAAASSTSILISNAAPVTDIDSLVISEDSPATDIDILANDTDADGDTLSISTVSTPAHGTAVIAGTVVRYVPEEDYNGSDSFTYMISDGIGGTASGTVNVTINAVNDAPIISDITSQATDEDVPTGAIPFTVDDIDSGALSILAPTSSNTTLVPVANIVFGGSGANRTVTIIPAASQSGSTTITLTVSDGALTASTSFTLNVAAVNDPPVNTALPTVSGTFVIGNTLTATPGSWQDSADGGTTTITYSYQWQRADDASGTNLTDIGGATNNTYGLTPADNGKYLRVVVTASDDGVPGTTTASAYSAYSNGSYAAPTETFVDDDFTSETPGWGYDHFATIQEGINAVAAGGTIQVAAGSYTENGSLNKNATLTLHDTITLNGSLTQSSGTLNAPTSLTLNGDWSCSAATFNHQNGLVTFNKTGSQQVQACSDFYDLVVSGDATLVSLSDLNVSHDITVNPGSHLDMNSFALLLAETSQGLTISTEQNLATPGNATFLGSSGMIINAWDAGLPLGQTTVSIADLPLGSSCFSGKTTIARCFTVTPVNRSGRAATLRFFFQPHDLNGLTCANLSVLHSSDGTTWGALNRPITRNCTTAPYWLEVSGVSDFSSFTLAVEPSTAVKLADLQADIVAEGIRLSWAVLDAHEMVGFRVYRRVVGERAFERVTVDLIPVRNTSAYSWLDTGAQPGVVYEYQVEAVTLSQVSLWLGPAQAQLYFNLWLPVLLR